MRGKPHPPEVKAAVTAALLAGQGVNEVAAAYNLDTGLVSRWRKAIPEDKLQQVAAKKADDFDDLISRFLQQTLITLSVQAEFFRDTTWLKGQDASSLAVLHGVQTDKAVRLLEALQNGAPDPDQPPDLP